MAQTEFQGVVRSGQVVFDTPLDLPDGTAVTVSESGSNGQPLSDERPRLSREEVAELDAFMAGWRDPADWPAFQAHLQQTYGIVTNLPASQPVPAESPVTLAGMWAHRPEMADAEAWVRRLRGARE